MANLEAEAELVAEVITMDTVAVGPIIKVTLTTNTISIMAMMMSTRQTNMVHHVHYVVFITTPLNIVLRGNTISMILWKMSWPENQGILFFYISKTLEMIRISFMASLLNAVL